MVLCFRNLNDKCDPLIHSSKRSIVLVMIVGGLVVISGALACLVGLIFTVPFAMLMNACAYLILDNQPGMSEMKDPMDELVDF